MRLANERRGCRVKCIRRCGCSCQTSSYLPEPMISQLIRLRFQFCIPGFNLYDLNLQWPWHQFWSHLIVTDDIETKVMIQVYAFILPIFWSFCCALLISSKKQTNIFYVCCNLAWRYFDFAIPTGIPVELCARIPARFMCFINNNFELHSRIHVRVLHQFKISETLSSKRAVHYSFCFHRQRLFALLNYFVPHLKSDKTKSNPISSQTNLNPHLDDTKNWNVSNSSTDNITVRVNSAIVHFWI